MPISSHQVGSMIGGQQAADVRSRFEDKVIQRGGCWLWDSCLNNGGYGRFWFSGRKVLAHRLAYQLYVGEIPKGMQVLHSCDQPRCVNPDHLHLGTQEDNQREMVNRGRAACGDRNGSRRRPESLRRGSSHGRAKLTEEQVRHIRASVEPVKILAVRHGVSDTLIRMIVNNRIWKHVA